MNLASGPHKNATTPLTSSTCGGASSESYMFQAVMHLMKMASSLPGPIRGLKSAKLPLASASLGYKYIYP